MEGQSHIPSCNSISAVGFIKSQDLKKSSLFRWGRDLVSSSRFRVLDITEQFHCQSSQRKKMFRKSQVTGLFIRFVVGFMASSVSIFNWQFAYWQVLVSAYLFRVHQYACTRTSFVLIWIFHAQFLGILNSNQVTSQSFLAHLIPISYFRGF